MDRYVTEQAANGPVTPKKCMTITPGQLEGGYVWCRTVGGELLMTEHAFVVVEVLPDGNIVVEDPL